MHAHGHRHADMDTCSHVGHVQTYVQHWLPIWWASMSHFSINACKLFQKGVQIRTSWRDDIPWHTHFPFSWLRNDVFQKKKKRSGCTWEHGTLRSGVFAVLLWCLGGQELHVLFSLVPSRGPGFLLEKEMRIGSFYRYFISELAISRNLGGMVRTQVAVSHFQVQMLSAMSNGYVHSTCICSNRCCFCGSGCLAVWALRGWSHAVLLWSVARAYPIEWYGMIRFFPGIFGNSISSEFACVCHVMWEVPLKWVVPNRSKLIN